MFIDSLSLLDFFSFRMSEPLLHSSMKAIIPVGVRELFKACGKGDLEAVTRLVESDGVDVKATATYGTVLDASPLFVAAFKGHYEIVRYLVGKGADIFAKTSEQSDLFIDELTPLYGAVASTVSTRQQDAIVRFLLEAAGSNVSALLTTTPVRNPVPIWAMPGCGPEATITLIKYGMSLNERTLFGNKTILQHWASKSLCYDDGSHQGSLLELVQLLVEKGCLSSPRFYGFTPLFLSATPGYRIRSLNFSVFDFLFEREEIDRLDKINALELAGAMILSYSSDPSQIPRAFAYWRRAHHLRYLIGADPIPKEPIIFEKTPQRVEWTTLPQLEEIENDPSQHKIASLLVHLRVLFAVHPVDLVFGMSHFLQSPVELVMYLNRPHQGFAEAVDSLLIALEFIIRYDRVQRQDTVKIIEKFVILLKRNPLCCTPELLKASAELIKAADLMMPTAFPLLETMGNRYDEMFTYIQILLRFVSILARHEDKINNSIMDALSQLVRHNGRMEGRLNLLLLACMFAKRRYGDGDRHLLINLPIIRLLLRARANPNAVTPRFRGPLHILADSNSAADQERINLLGNLLVEKGAHPYMVDEEGRTAADIWLLVRNQGPQQENHRELDRNDLPDWCVENVPKLKCLSAKIVRRSRIPYVNKIPATLYPFIEKH